MDWLPVLCGLVIGFTLGLTGGGGAILAVPALVYVLGVPSKEAVGVSLLAVGIAAAVGCLLKWRRGNVAIQSGLTFAIAGMVCTPLGSRLGGLMPEAWHLGSFALLMLVVAVFMWRKADHRPTDPVLPNPQRDIAILIALGALVGVLSGLFGVGGGFIIVPALVLVTGMPMQKAIGTSMLVIALVSASGVVSHHLAGRELHFELAAWFVAGSLVGLGGGTWLGARLSGPLLQRIFALVVLAVGGIVLLQVLQ